MSNLQNSNEKNPLVEMIVSEIEEKQQETKKLITTKINRIKKLEADLENQVKNPNQTENQLAKEIEEEKKGLQKLKREFSLLRKQGEELHAKLESKEKTDEMEKNPEKWVSEQEKKLKEQRDHLESEIETLKKTDSTLDETGRQLKEQKQKASERLENRKKVLEMIKQNRKKAKASRKSRETMIGTFEEKMTDQIKLTEARIAKEKVEQAKNQLQQGLNQMRGHVEGIRKEQQQWMEEYNKTMEDLKQNKEETKKDIEEFEVQIAQLEATAKEIEEKKFSLQTRITEIEKALQEVGKMEQNTEEIHKIIEQRSSLDQQTLAEAEQTVANLKKARDENIQKMKFMRAKADEVTGKIDTHIADLQANITRIEQQRDVTNNLKEQEETFNEKYGQLQKRKAELAKIIEQETDELHMIQKEYSRLSMENQDDEKKPNDPLKKTSQNLPKNVDQLEKQRESIMSRIETNTKTINLLKTQETQLKKTSQQTQNSKAETQKILAAIPKKIKSLTQEISVLEISKKQIDEQISESKKQSEKVFLPDLDLLKETDELKTAQSLFQKRISEMQSQLSLHKEQLSKMLSFTETLDKQRQLMSTTYSDKLNNEISKKRAKIIELQTNKELILEETRRREAQLLENNLEIESQIENFSSALLYSHTPQSPTQTNPTYPDHLMEQFVAIQNIDGSWQSSDSFFQILNLTQSQVEKLMPKEISSQIWYTIVGAAFLTSCFPQRKLEWESFVDTSFLWLKNHSVDSVQSYLQIASKLFV